MAETIRDGGPAFPVFADGNARNYTTSVLNEGISIRDWFAGQALTAILRWDFAEGQSYEELAEQAYMAADAMLAEQEKGNG